MKHTTIFISIFLIFSIPAQAEVQMIPVKDILESNENAAGTSIMLERCSALFAVFRNWIEMSENTMPPTAEEKKGLDTTKKRLLKNIEISFHIWLALQRGKPDLDDSEEVKLYIELWNDKIKIIRSEYKKRIRKSENFTGSIFSDSIINQDNETCGNFARIVKFRHPRVLEK